MGVSERKFGTLPTGEEIKIYHLENKSGAYAEVLRLARFWRRYVFRIRPENLEMWFWDMMISKDMK